jgi:hypothetical protein
MTNMSYCRFRNTLGDLEDCAEQLRALFYGEEHDKVTNREEKEARAKLLELCCELAEMVDDERRCSGREGLAVKALIEEREKDNSEG